MAILVNDICPKCGHAGMEQVKNELCASGACTTRKSAAATPTLPLT